MAKKVAKKNSKNAPQKLAKKPAASAKASSKAKPKAPAKKAQTKQAASKPASAPKLVGMHSISTGSGTSAAEIGSAVVAHINSGAHDDTPLWDKYWSKDFVSIEGIGANLAWYGRAAVKEKCEGWMNENTVHGCRAEGPFVGSTGFSVHITMDVEEKKSGNRRTMREVGVYTVQNGKVVREEFMYAT